MIWTRVESMCNFIFYHVTLFRLWYEVCTPHSTASFIYSECHNVNLPLLMSCHIYYTGPFSWYAARANINRLELNIFCCILCRYCPPVFVSLLQATKNEQAKKAFPSRSSLLTATQASINKWHLFLWLTTDKTNINRWNITCFWYECILWNPRYSYYNESIYSVPIHT